MLGRIGGTVQAALVLQFSSRNKALNIIVSHKYIYFQRILEQKCPDYNLQKSMVIKMQKFIHTHYKVKTYEFPRLSVPSDLFDVHLDQLSVC